MKKPRASSCGARVRNRTRSRNPQIQRAAATSKRIESAKSLLRRLAAGRPFIRQPIDLPPHLIKLALEIVDLAGLRRRIARFRGSFGGLTLAPRKRREHREGAFEHF